MSEALRRCCSRLMAMTVEHTHRGSPGPFSVRLSVVGKQTPKTVVNEHQPTVTGEKSTYQLLGWT
jgi:hypothetical protein